MPKIAYTEKNFRADALDIVEKANTVIEEYQAAGYTLTLRQLYYQFVSRDWIPNKQSEYKRLGSIIGDARLAGLIDWTALEDRGRNLIVAPTWDNPASIVDACASQFKLDLWEDQDYHVEVWIEKEALIGVVEPVCRELRVGAFACKGYVSLSEMWDAAYNRLRHSLNARRGKRVIILHMGDHDPSGLDMTRDISDRLNLLAATSSGVPIEVKRLALNMPQIEEHNPPPNPAKVTDSRFTQYAAKFGDESWELDALPPDLLNNLIRENVEKYRDDGRFEVMLRKEDAHRETLKRICNNWDSVEKFLNKGKD